MKKSAYKEVLFLVGFWVICASFIVSYDRSLIDAVNGQLGQSPSYVRDLMIVIAVTVVGGLFVAGCDVFLLSRKLRTKPFGFTLLARTAFYMSCIFVFTSTAELAVRMFESNLAITEAELWVHYTSYVLSPRLLTVFVFWGSAVVVGLFVVMVSQKFGQGVLVDFLRGKYHRPREEERIFMFLDLKSSTTHAERLGHIAYSRLIQDCFFDLTDVVTAHRATIYQYVGDEAVLTWRLPDGVQNANCLRMFFAFDDVLVAKGGHYESVYGFVPEFKAGVHAGLVTAAEVGEIKKELAYHGDVLNTAARIQGKCNELGARLLLSSDLKGRLIETSGIAFDFAGQVALRGREQTAEIYSAGRLA